MGLLAALNPASPTWEEQMVGIGWTLFWVYLIIGVLFGLLWLAWRAFCAGMGWDNNSEEEQS